MYLVTIINNGVETAINEVSTKTDNRISGTIKQGINTINSFTFTILPNNQGYNLINPLSTLVKVLNTKTNKYEFIGRVLSPTHSMDSNGLMSKSYVCESELGYLLDTYQSYEEIHNISVRGYLERLIQAHNNNTDSSKKFVVGNVTVVDNNDSLYRYIAYDTTKKNIDDDLLDKLGGELQIRYEGDTRYLDYLTEIGKVCSTEIRLAKNLQDLEQNIDVSNYCNRLVVLGAKLKVKDEDGNETDTEERLTIESVNNGLKYIDDAESIAKYGVIQGQVIYDDVTEAKNLLSKGQKYLLNQRLLVSNKVNALDLSLIGIDIDSFEVGNYYPLIHEILGINDVVRVVEKSISIDSPHTNSITLGDLEKDIKKYNIQAKKGYSEVIKISKENKNKVLQVENYATNEIYRLDDRINNITVDIGDKLEQTDNLIKNTDNKIQQVKSIVDTISYLMPTPQDVETNTNILQGYLNKAKEIGYKIKIKFPKGTYKIYPCYIFSNTEIEMCDETVLEYVNRKVLDTEKNELVTQSSIFYNARPFNSEDSKITGYNGNSNITIAGGTIKGGCITMVHGKNIEFKSLTIKDIKVSHAFQISACKNVFFNKCNFIGHIAQEDDRNYVELIQIDWMTYGGVPGWESNSPIYDNTIEENIVIEKCTFQGSNTEGYGALHTAVGSHSKNDDYKNKNITIKDCIIKDCTYAGITAIRMNGVNIINCTFENCNCSGGATILVDNTDNYIITNNKAINCKADYMVKSVSSTTGLINNNISNNSILEKN